jgi:hypothetical protein
MAVQFAVRGDGLDMTIAVEGYQFPQLTSGSDANWLAGTVELRAGTTGVFTARQRLWLFAPDLERFRDKLRTLDRELSGEATLKHLEGQLDVTIELSNGSGTVKGGVNEHVGAELNFAQIPTDQTYVRRTLQELEAVLSTFPARPRPSD